MNILEVKKNYKKCWKNFSKKICNGKYFRTNYKNPKRKLSKKCRKHFSTKTYIILEILKISFIFKGKIYLRILDNLKKFEKNSYNPENILKKSINS